MDRLGAAALAPTASALVHYLVLTLFFLFSVVIPRGVLASTAEQTDIQIVLMEADNDSKCNGGIRCPPGTFCSESRCMDCSPCPDVYNHRSLLRGSNTLWTMDKCYRDGWCPDICSSMRLDPEEQAGMTLCNELEKANACDKTCNDRGALNSTVCVCSCNEPWNGLTCTDCKLDCGDEGTLLESTCNCLCRGSWTGPKCTVCDISCNNGGTLDRKSCQCDCERDWTGTTCSECRDRSCNNGGILNTTSCECKCSEGWTGKSCTDVQVEPRGSTLKPPNNEVEPRGSTLKPKTEPDGETLKNVVAIFGGAVVLLVVLVAIVCFTRKYMDCTEKQRSSQNELKEILMKSMKDSPPILDLTVRLGDDSPILSVNNRQELDRFTILEICCCLRMDKSKYEKHIKFPPEEDTIKLPTKNYHLVPGLQYLVKAGNISENGTFNLVAQGSFISQETSLDNSILECNTTIGDILNDITLCKSLEVELNDLNQIYLSEHVAEAFELNGDQCRRVKDAGNDNHLDILRSILWGKLGDELEVSIHDLMDHLKDKPEASLFMERLARFTHKNQNCAKCMRLLHSSH